MKNTIFCRYWRDRKDMSILRIQTCALRIKIVIIAAVNYTLNGNFSQQYRH